MSSSPRQSSSTRWILIFAVITVTPFHGLADEPANDGSPESQSGKETAWNIEQPPGEQFDQTIDTTEGTWINLDVSPDGTQIVFDLLGDIYSMPISGADGTDGNFPKKLTSGVAWDMQPRFSPDGHRIAFTSDRTGKSKRAGDNIWTMRADGSQLRQVTNETYRLLNGPAWSPDGNYLVARKHFTSRRSLGAGEMWMYHRAALDANAMAGVQLTKRPNDQKDVNEPVFSPDGKYLYYSQDATPGDSFEYDKDSNKQIYVVKRLDLETGETESYITGPGGACRPTPSPDGKRIAFVRRIGAKTALHVLDTESGSIRPVYDQLERDMQEAWAIHGVYPSFAWMPDGQSLVLWAKGRIRRIQVDDGQETLIPFHIKDSRKVTRSLRFPIEVAPDEFPVRMLRWVQTSPNGKQVAFQALGHIYVCELPDGKPRRLTAQTDHFEFYPSYSRDGRYIVYSTWNDDQLGSVRIASVSGGGDQESWKVTDQPGHYTQPVFSPDGKTVVYVKSSGGYLRSPLWSRDTGLYRVAARGGEPRRISKSGSDPQFAQANDRVFFVQSDSNKDADNLGLFSIGLDGQEKRQHFTSKWGTEYRISPNGKWIAFVERFNVHLSPFVQTGQTIEIGPGSTALPTAKVSHDAGDWIHFSGDGQKLHWALGPQLFTHSLADAFDFLAGDASTDEPNETDTEDAAPEAIDIGFTHKHAKPDSTVALVGGRIVTMGDAGVIENGTIVIRENRILELGRRDEIEIPDGAEVFEIPGLVVLPGLVDTHAHGASGDFRHDAAGELDRLCQTGLWRHHNPRSFQ